MFIRSFKTTKLSTDPQPLTTLSNRGLLTCAPAKREWQSLEVLKMKQLLQFYFCRHSALRKDCFNMVAAVLRDWRAALRRHCTVLIAGEHTTVICLGLRNEAQRMDVLMS